MCISVVFILLLAVDCGLPDNVVANGNVRVTMTTFNSNAMYECDFGYRLRGEESTRCLANGNWSNPPPSCICKQY